MKRMTAPLLALTFGLLSLANAHAQGARLGLIKNGSFESPAVEEGSFSVGIPDWAWTGWSSNTINAIIHPGGPGSREPWPTTPPPGIDGKNFCQLYASGDGGSGVLFQDTGIKYQAGVTYTLTAAFALQMTDGKFAPNCVMFLGNSSFAQFGALTISEASLTTGEFKDQTVTYTATGSEAPGDGTFGAAGDVIVGFWLVPNLPANSYLDLDNVRLKAPRQTRPVPSAPSAAPAASPADTPNYFGTHM
jgi:hypothetical protein